MKILAIDIGGTAVKIALTTEKGEILKKEEMPTESQKGAPDVIKRICGKVKEYSEYESIGISTAGQVDSKKGEIIFANENLPGYTGMKVKKIFEEKFNVPVAVENDVNAAAIGEGFYGSAKNFNDYMCLTFGTGVGGAIVINRQVYKGFDGIAGEFGHMIIHPGGILCNCGARGCYEKYAATSALIKEVQKVNYEINNGREIFEEIDKGNETILSILDNWIDEIVLGIVNIVHIFNPKALVLGGGILEQEYVITQIKSKVKSKIMDSFSKVQIIKAETGNNAGILGATYLATKLLSKKDKFDLISKIETYMNNFTKTEQKIAEFIINNPKKALSLSITDLAEACGVGDTSVFRFCKSLNLKGYQHFKVALAKSIAQEENGLPQVDTKVAKDDSTIDVARKVLNANIDSMQKTFDLIKEEEIEKAVKYLLEADRIVFFGVGGSHVTGLEARNKFMRITPNVECIEDGHLQTMRASLLDEKSVAIVVSYSGITKDSVHIAKLAKEAGAKVICVTRYSKTLLTEYADVTLLSAALEGPLQGGSLSAKSSQKYIMDILYLDYFKRTIEESENNKETTTIAISEKIF